MMLHCRDKQGKTVQDTASGDLNREDMLPFAHVPKAATRTTQNRQAEVKIKTYISEVVLPWQLQHQDPSVAVAGGAKLGTQDLC